MLYRAEEQKGRRTSKANLPEEALWWFFSLSPPPSLLLFACVPDPFLCRLAFSISVWLQAQCSIAARSPLKQPDHMSLPHRGLFAFFLSVRGQNDEFILGLVSLPDPVLYGGGRRRYHCPTSATDAKSCG